MPKTKTHYRLDVEKDAREKMEGHIAFLCLPEDQENAYRAGFEEMNRHCMRTHRNQVSDI